MKACNKTKRNLVDYLMIISIALTFTGETIKVFAMPLYLYGFLLTIICMSITELYKFKLTMIDLFAFIWLISATFGVLAYQNSIGKQQYYSTITDCVLILCASAYCKSIERVDLCIKTIAIVFIPFLIVNTIELITGIRFSNMSDMYLRMSRDSAASFFVNVNDNTTVIVCTLFIVCLYNTQHTKWKMILIGAGVIIVAFIGSRLAMFTCIVVFTFKLITSYVYKKVGNVGSIKSILIIIAPLILIIVIGSYINSSTLIQKISSDSEIGSDIFRLQLLSTAIAKIGDASIILGMGPGGAFDMLHTNPHAMLFEMLLDYGIVVFSLLLTIIGKLVLSFKKNIPFKDSQVYCSFAIAFVIMSFCSSSMIRIRCVFIIMTVIYKKYRLSKN